MHCRYLSVLIMSLATFLLSIFAGCQTVSTLNEIDTYIQERPDSALAAIRAIDTTTLATRSLRAHYALLYAMALDKNWIDTTDINVVMPAVDYYAKHGNADQRMKSYYYLGRIQQNGRDLNAAIISFTQAEAASDGSQDDGFKGLLSMVIAEIYKSAHYSDKERAYLEKGMNLFQKAGDTTRYNLSFGRLAMNYQGDKNWKMADSLYSKGIVLAEQDTAAMRMFLSHYAAMKVVQPEPDPQGAITLLKRLYSEYKTNLPLKEYGIYAYASALVGDDKTCDSILEMLSRQPDARRKDTRYAEYLITKYRKDYSLAIDLLTDIYSEQDKYVTQMLNNSITTNLQDYYQAQAIESRRQTQVQRLSFAVVLLGLSLLFGAILFLSFRKREKDRIAADNLIRIAEETNAMMAQSKSEVDAQVSSLQQAYIQLFKSQFDTVNSLCKTYLKFQERSEDVRKAAVYGKVKDILSFIGKDKKQQAVFEEQINRDFNNIVARLKTDLGNVSDEDARFICYTIAGFDSNIIATLLNLSLSNVYTKRSRLKERIRQLDTPYKAEYLRVI